MNTQNLYALVRASRKSQNAISKELGITQQCLSNYVHGQREPDFEMAVRLAEYFQVSLEYLAGREPPAVERDADDVRRWTQRLRSLTPSDLSLFVRVLESMEENPKGTRAALDLALTAAKSIPQVR